MKILTVWYSRTGTAAALARQAQDVLRQRGHDVAEASLRPQVELPYLLWLAQSFIPGSLSPLEGGAPNPAGYDGCLLVTPKWTFSCPPINAFLAEVGARLPPTALAVVCGGFDQERYLAELENRIEGMGVFVLRGITVKRDAVTSAATATRLVDFLERCFPTKDQPPPGCA